MLSMMERTRPRQIELEDIEDQERRSKCRDTFAATISLLPGAGQAFKGHLTRGVLTALFFAGCTFVSLLLCLETWGFSLLAPVVMMAGSSLDAYALKDSRKNHWCGF